MTFIILDFETTGLERDCMPVEIGAVSVECGLVKIEGEDVYGWNILGHFSTLNNPGIDVHPKALAIHGISNERVAHLEVGAGIQALHNWLVAVRCSQSSNLEFDAFVCHNTAYDIPILHRVLPAWKDGIKSICTMIHPDRSPVLDIGKVNQYGHPAWPKLVDAAEFIGYNFVGAHSALSDAMACLALFKYEVEHGLLKL